MPNKVNTKESSQYLTQRTHEFASPTLKNDFSAQECT